MDAGIGSPLPHHALLRQRTPERHARRSTCAHQLERALRHPEQAHAVVDAARTEPRLRHRETAALLAEQIRDRHPHLVERDFGVAAVLAIVVAEDGQRAHDGDSRRVPPHEDHALLAVPLSRGIGLAHHDEERSIRIHRAGRPPFAAGDHI